MNTYEVRIFLFFVIAFFMGTGYLPTDQKMNEGKKNLQESEKTALEISHARTRSQQNAVAKIVKE